MIAITLIRHDLRKSLGISTLQYMICDAVCIYQTSGVECTVENLSEDLGISRQTISKCITELLSSDPRLILSYGDVLTPTDSWKSAVYTTASPAKVETETMKLTSEVIKSLNEAYQSHFKASAWVGNIGAIVKRDPSIGIRQFEAVIQHKKIQWGDDEKMREYLKPSTLFGSPGKFLRYLDDARSYWKQRDKLNQLI